MEQILKQQNNINEIKNYFNIVQKYFSIQMTGLNFEKQGENN